MRGETLATCFRNSLLAVVLVAGMLASSLAATRPAAAQPVYPTVTIEVVRIAEIDPIDLPPAGEWDWYYWIVLMNEVPFSGTRYEAPNGQNVTVGQSHAFTAKAQTFHFALVLCEGDTLLPDDTADISSSPGGGADDTDCPASPLPVGAYQGAWNLTTDTLSGDTVVVDAEGYRASGDLDGSTAVDENDANLWFTVNDTYATPVANAGHDQEGWLNDSFIFDGRGSNGTNASIESYAWDFNDDGIAEATDPVAVWRFTAKGQHPVWLTVTDSIGGTDTELAVVTIKNHDPTARFVFAPADPRTGGTVQFADASSDVDGTIVRWDWRFGDGGTSHAADPSHAYTTAGTYKVSLFVWDNDGGATYVERTITVQGPTDVGPLLWVGIPLLVVFVLLAVAAYRWFRKNPPSDL